MHVAISTSVIQRGQTGVAQYVFSLAQQLRCFADQHHFTLFVLEEDLPLFDFAKSDMQIISVSEKFRAPIKNIFWHQTKLPALIRKHKIDVLHIPSYRRMLWQKPCALVTTIHDLAAFRVAKKYDWKRMFYGRVVAKHLARKQDQIIAISENTANDLEQFFSLSRENITVIHNGLDSERFGLKPKEVAKNTLTQRFKINSPFFLYLARLEHPGKNHVRLIQAFNRFKAETNSDWHLVFGGSDWHGAEVIHDTIHRSPFGRDIHSLGFVSTPDLPILYNAADVFVYPSLYEGFGLPPIEAMACGCPVISSTRGSLGEVVGNAAKIIEPENVLQIRNALAELAGHPERRKELREAGLMRAKLFDWKKTTEATLEVYRKALEEIKGGAKLTSASRQKTLLTRSA